jgi:hypothetical protein
MYVGVNTDLVVLAPLRLLGKEWKVEMWADPSGEGQNNNWKEAKTTPEAVADEADEHSPRLYSAFRRLVEYVKTLPRGAKACHVAKKLAFRDLVYPAPPAGTIAAHLYPWPFAYQEVKDDYGETRLPIYLGWRTAHYLRPDMRIIRQAMWLGDVEAFVTLREQFMQRVRMFLVHYE